MKIKDKLYLVLCNLLYKTWSTIRLQEDRRSLLYAGVRRIRTDHGPPSRWNGRPSWLMICTQRSVGGGMKQLLTSTVRPPYNIIVVGS